MKWKKKSKMFSKTNNPSIRGAYYAPLIFFIFFAISCTNLISITLPNWVINIPSANTNTFAVGVSNNYSNIDLAIEKAFDMACYDLACQKKATVKSKTLDIVGGDLVFFESILPDSSDILFYENNAKILSYFIDDRYTYLLAAIDSVDIDTQLIEINESSLLTKRNKYYSDDYIYRGYGISNYVDALGFVYANIRARINICEQLSIKNQSLIQEENINTSVISEKSNEIRISRIRITGYFVNYDNNEITAFAEYSDQEE